MTTRLIFPAALLWAACSSAPSAHCPSGVDCAGTQDCASAGTCAALDPPQDSGGDQPPDAGAESCGGQLFEATRVQPNFLIVLDHSGSMMESAGGEPKWTAAVSAVTQLTRQHEDAIRFGLQLFSFAGAKCSAGKQDVAVGDSQAQPIASALPDSADGNGTPISGALEVARASPGLHDAARSNNVLLITDGEENCNGDPVAQVQALFAAGVKTYVVGFGSGVDAALLSQMAVEGGTAQAGSTRYYQADDPAALNAALALVAQGALGCDLQLAEVPPDPDQIFVYVNGQLQARDPAKQSGWDYDRARNRLTLYGASCGVLTEDANAKVSLVYGCPDESLVEGGTHPGDAGTVPAMDGGSPIN